MTVCNHRRRLVCAGLLGLLAAGVPAQAGTYLEYASRLGTSPPEGARFRPDLEEKLDGLLNAYRREKGREPVVRDPTFLIPARAHAADMMLHNFVGHTASTGNSFQGRMSAFAGDVTKYPALGENAARETRDTPVDDAKLRALFQQWIDSRSHRKNMVSRGFQLVSTGVIQRGHKIWAVQIFFGTPRQKGLFQ
ncbi:CAP domain-containing protein [Aestuariivirga sp.]|uniref:CAP domain-containing protein n=1 Tax=Aestuariivirga sp. TaxID=2650926 RepID=UPI0037833593